MPGFSRPGLHHLVPPLMRRATRLAVRDLYGGGAEPVAAIVSSRVDDAVVGRAGPTPALLLPPTTWPAGADLLGVPP